jgi:hypothetical protein
MENQVSTKKPHFSHLEEWGSCVSENLLLRSLLSKRFTCTHS